MADNTTINNNYLSDLDNFLTKNSLAQDVSITQSNSEAIIGDGAINASKIKDLKVDTITVTPGGYIESGKTSFTDSVNPGFYFSSDGLYVGAANDTSKLLYKISDGTFDFVGTVSSLSTATIASAINTNGQIITDVINSKLDTSASQILGDFTFGASGGISMITDSNNGLWLSPTGILAKKAGANTLAIGIDGNAVFSGELSAAYGILGAVQVSSGGYIRGGQTDFNTGVGWFLGNSAGAYKLSIGNPAGNYLTYDGQYLKLKGSFDVGTGGLINNSIYTVANLPIAPTATTFKNPSGIE